MSIRYLCFIVYQLNTNQTIELIYIIFMHFIQVLICLIIHNFFLIRVHIL